MKAIQIKQYGDADVLEITQIPEPTPSTDQLLIENKAIGINPFDWKLRNGLFQDLFPLEFPNILGLEIAGVVKQVPAHVKTFESVIVCMVKQIMPMPSSFPWMSLKLTIFQNL